MVKVWLAAFGEKIFKTLAQRLSGERLTAVFNSIIAAFMAYCSLRESGLSEDQAWSALGMYGGDDGITADLLEEFFIMAARKLGFEVKTEVIDRGRWGVNFLNRYYTENVWNGDPCSTRDIARCMAGLHLTASRYEGLTGLDLVTLKAEEILIHDPISPIISDWARAVTAWADACGVKPNPKFLELVSYNCRPEVTRENDFAYPNEADGRLLDKLFDQGIDYVDPKFLSWLCEKPVSNPLAMTSWLRRTPLLQTCEIKPSTNFEVDGICGEESDIRLENAVPQTALGHTIDLRKRRENDRESSGRQRSHEPDERICVPVPRDDTSGNGVRQRSDTEPIPESHPVCTDSGTKPTRAKKRRDREKRRKLAAGGGVGGGTAPKVSGSTDGPKTHTKAPKTNKRSNSDHQGGEPPSSDRSRVRGPRKRPDNALRQDDGGNCKSLDPLRQQEQRLFGPTHTQDARNTKEGRQDAPDNSRSSAGAKGNKLKSEKQNKNQTKKQKSNKNQENLENETKGKKIGKDGATNATVGI
jgi:hypothetical protein